MCAQPILLSHWSFLCQKVGRNLPKFWRNNFARFLRRGVVLFISAIWRQVLTNFQLFFTGILGEKHAVKLSVKILAIVKGVSIRIFKKNYVWKLACVACWKVKLAEKWTRWRSEVLQLLWQKQVKIIGYVQSTLTFRSSNIKPIRYVIFYQQFTAKFRRLC